MSQESTPGSGGWSTRRVRLRDWLAGEELDPITSAQDRELHSAAVLAMTLTLIILLVGAPPQTHTLTPLVAIAGLAVPGLARNRWYWVGLTGLFAISPLTRPWLELDNHGWLELYWFLAITVSRFAARPDTVLRLSARWLVGLAFLFAVLWKLFSRDFVTGAFFDVTFAIDTRLGDVAVAFGLQDPSAMASNRALIAGWRTPGQTPAPGQLEMSPTLLAITPLLAWLTILVEAALAVAFLAPLTARVRWLRDATLLLFLVATYPLAPVTGFGRLLIAMSAMQSELLPRLRAGVYVGAFILVTLLRERAVALEWIQQLLGTGGT